VSKTPSTNTSQISVLYTTHRPENIPLLRGEMIRCDAVFLEEAASPGLSDMLAGRISIADYLAFQDDEYPEFSHRFCRMLRELHQNGVAIYQVEPFMDVLISIHEFFADGGRPSELAAGTEVGRVYAAEHQATGALLDFYRAALLSRFEATVSAVKRFARADAQRFRLRDEMRADALAPLVKAYPSSCVEAGTMHQWLLRRLQRRIGDRGRVRPVHPLQPRLSAAGARRRNLGPGDILTLVYTYRPGASGPILDLMAARSLVYVKLLEKEEMAGGPDEFPHMDDELEAGRIADRLSYEDCRRLYPLIRRVSTADAREVVSRYLSAQGVTVDGSTG
jgi:hypothetical protein